MTRGCKAVRSQWDRILLPYGCCLCRLIVYELPGKPPHVLKDAKERSKRGAETMCIHVYIYMLITSWAYELPVS